MRNVVLSIFVLLIGCTKKNPNLCCTDPADCMAIGLPDGKSCSDGLVCRGHECIAEMCSTSADCESLAPYCENGLCGPTCTDDTACPGAGLDPNAHFCVSGACIECRAGMNDCPAATPVCDMSSCRACVKDDECSSTVCDVDTGACVSPDSIRYAADNGLDANPCTQVSPCSITKAVSIVDLQHPLVRMLPGNYPGVSLGSGNVTLVGTGATSGEVAAQLSGTNATVRGLKVIGGTGTSIACSGGAKLALRDVNTTDISTTTSCQLSLVGVTGPGTLNLIGNIVGSVDRSYFSGIYISPSTSITFTMTNSIANGVTIALPNTTGLSIQFAYNTFYYNGQFGQNTIVDCTNPYPANAVTFFNNIFYDPSNSDSIAGTHCTFKNNIAFPQATLVPNTIFLDPKLVDPATGDFHLMANSPAIDAAISTTLDPTVDYDGTTRPQGAQRDIGAFEYKP